MIEKNVLHANLTSLYILFLDALRRVYLAAVSSNSINIMRLQEA